MAHLKETKEKRERKYGAIRERERGSVQTGDVREKAKMVACCLEGKGKLIGEREIVKLVKGRGECPDGTVG